MPAAVASNTIINPIFPNKSYFNPLLLEDPSTGGPVGAVGLLQVTDFIAHDRGEIPGVPPLVTDHGERGTDSTALTLQGGILTYNVNQFVHQQVPYEQHYAVLPDPGTGSRYNSTVPMNEPRTVYHSVADVLPGDPMIVTLANWIA